MNSNLPIRKRIDYTIEKADQYGNPIVIDELAMKTILIWSFYGQKLVARIQNATYDEVKQGILESDLVASKFSIYQYVVHISNGDISKLKEPIEINQLRSKLPKALISSYCYDDRLNLISMTDANGLVFEYEYDVLDRLKAEYRKVGDKTELIKSYKYNYYSSDKKL